MGFSNNLDLTAACRRGIILFGVLDASLLIAARTGAAFSFPLMAPVCGITTAPELRALPLTGCPRLFFF